MAATVRNRGGGADRVQEPRNPTQHPARFLQQQTLGGISRWWAPVRCRLNCELVLYCVHPATPTLPSVTADDWRLTAVVRPSFPAAALRLSCEKCKKLPLDRSQTRQALVARKRVSRRQRKLGSNNLVWPLANSTSSHILLQTHLSCCVSVPKPNRNITQLAGGALPYPATTTLTAPRNRC